MKTNKKGISLIVLAITIVVMIVLATAIILSLTSNDIVDSAKGATKAGDLANARHVVAVADGECQMEPESCSDFVKYAEEKLEAAGYKINGGEGSIEVTLNGDVYMYPTIPEGFTVSNVPGERKVSTGLVIKDKSGNEFVWVPVEDIATFKRVDWGKGISTKNTTSYNQNDAREAIEYQSMKESVEKYGGFYIGRYEAGSAGPRTEQAVGYKETPLVIKGVIAYYYVSWKDAKDVCEKLTTDHVVGHLIYGEEWDAALNFISKTDSTYPTESSYKGNYYPSGKGTITTGDEDGYALNNIYDMAGNVDEFTMEVDENSYAIVRGGNAKTGAMSGDQMCSGSRSAYSSSSGSPFVGFRVALYIK